MRNDVTPLAIELLMLNHAREHTHIGIIQWI